MTKTMREAREEFENIFGFTPGTQYIVGKYTKEDIDNAYSWHINQLQSVFEEIEKEVIGKDLIPKPDRHNTKTARQHWQIVGNNGLRFEQRQKLNSPKNQVSPSLQ